VRLKSYGLGSCIGLVIWDRARKIGGMAHILLPAARNHSFRHKSAKYASSAVTVLVEELLGRGCDHKQLVAKIAGGANMFPLRFNLACSEPGTSIGQLNVRAVKQALVRRKIPLVSEEIGGERGRTIEFDPRSGELFVYNSSGEVKVI